MDFLTLCEKVATVTNRPDLEDEIKEYVRSSVLKMHGIDFFFRDLVVSKVIFPEALYIQKLNTDQFARYRNTAVIRKWDSSLNDQELNPLLSPRQDASGLVIFKNIEPSDIFDEQYPTLLKTDVYYAAGSMLYMRSLTAFDSILLGFYTFPDVTLDNFETWLMQNHPYAIIYDASSVVFQATGQNDQSRKFDEPTNGLIAQQIAGIVKANTVAKAY